MRQKSPGDDADAVPEQTSPNAESAEVGAGKRRIISNDYSAVSLISSPESMIDSDYRRMSSRKRQPKPQAVGFVSWQEIKQRRLWKVVPSKSHKKEADEVQTTQPFLSTPTLRDISVGVSAHQDEPLGSPKSSEPTILAGGGIQPPRKVARTYNASPVFQEDAGGEGTIGFESGKLRRSGHPGPRRSNSSEPGQLAYPESEEPIGLPIDPAPKVPPKTSTSLKSTIDVEFWIVKAREPLLDIERWWEGKFQGRTLDLVVEGVASITQCSRIEKIKCILETSEKRCTVTVQRDGDAAFEALKRSFREEMALAFRKNCNRMKPFKILIEPAYSEGSIIEGESENEGAVMGDW